MTRKLYVCMTDKLMSGWGGAEGKINKYVILCDNWEQAEQIEAAAHKRPEMKYINVNIRRPYYSPARYTVTVMHYNGLGDKWTGGLYRTDNEEQEG